jgi:hypothetical protein
VSQPPSSPTVALRDKMSATPPGSPIPTTRNPTTNRSLRYWGVLVLVLFFLTSAVGGSLALEGSYLVVTLASHIGLALVTMGLAGYATRVVGRDYTVGARASAGVASLAALGATIAGTVFLVEGQSNSALYAMEGLALLGLLAAVLMIILGGPTGVRDPAGRPN